MKKRKISLWLNIVTICLSICAIAVGVYSAKQTKLSISGSIGFTAYTNANVVCKVTGAKLKSDSAYSGETYYVTPNGVTTSNTSENEIKMTKDTKPLDFSDLSFAYDQDTKEPIDMVFTFTIKNTSSDVIVADLNIDGLVFNSVIPSWGTDGALQIITPESSSATGDVKSQTADIVLTLHLTQNTNIDKAISGSMNLNIEAAQQTTDGFVVDTSGNLTTVPATSESNASITIPAYYYDGTNTYRKVKQLYINTSGTTAINNISSYTSVIISNGVPTIGSYAFANCYDITNISIPASVTKIGNYAFYNCSSLTNITLPESVTNILDYAFYNCSSLNSINIPKSVTQICQEVFSSTGLKSVTLPEGVTTIASKAFQYCSSLTSITIPASITKIESSAFASCMSLRSITIPNGVTSIESNTFDDCGSLQSVTIPSSVTNIKYSAFNSCSCLTNITFQGTKVQWEAITFDPDWGNGVGNYTIHCTDGDITKS